MQFHICGKFSSDYFIHSDSIFMCDSVWKNINSTTQPAKVCSIVLSSQPCSLLKRSVIHLHEYYAQSVTKVIIRITHWMNAMRFQYSIIHLYLREIYKVLTSYHIDICN